MSAVIAVYLGMVIHRAGSDLPSDRHEDPVPPVPSQTSPTDTDAFLANIVVKGLDGRDIPLKKYHGKWLLINYWATWCGPCREEMPDLETIWSQQQKAGLEMLAVSDEDPHDIWGFLHQGVGETLTYPIGCDSTGQLKSALGFGGIPYTLMVDPGGKVIFRLEGMGDKATFLSALKSAGFPLR
jgi:thiol-disulfide isomerase/thioredoxin